MIRRFAKIFGDEKSLDARRSRLLRRINREFFVAPVFVWNFLHDRVAREADEKKAMALDEYLDLCYSVEKVISKK